MMQDQWKWCPQRNRISSIKDDGSEFSLGTLMMIRDSWHIEQLFPVWFDELDVIFRSSADICDGVVKGLKSVK